MGDPELSYDQIRKMRLEFKEVLKEIKKVEYVDLSVEDELVVENGIRVGPRYYL